MKLKLLKLSTNLSWSWSLSLAKTNLWTLSEVGGSAVQPNFLSKWGFNICLGGEGGWRDLSEIIFCKNVCFFWVYLFYNDLKLLKTYKLTYKLTKPLLIKITNFFNDLYHVENWFGIFKLFVPKCTNFGSGRGDPILSIQTFYVHNTLSKI